MQAIEKAAIEKERAREAALAVNDGHSRGALTLTLPGAEDETDESSNVRVNVVVDMTDEGKKVGRPTPDKPAYYVALPMGNKEFGYAPFYQKSPPTPAEVKALLDKELSKQGYLIATRQHDPSLVLAFFWGYLSKSAGTLPEGVDGTEGFVRSFIRGNPYATDYNKAPTDYKFEIYDQIWYVMVSAFDANDWVHHKKTLLWCAHIYTPLWGHYLEQVLPTLITTAGPMLGHETSRPQVITAPMVPEGRVIVGTPEVKDFQSKSAAPAPSPKP